MTSNQPNQRRSIFPEPLIVPPHSTTLPHTQTFILLHGRGSSASIFGPAILSTPFPIPNPPTTNDTKSSETTSSSASTDPSATESPGSIATLQTLFPTAKFLFPQAAYSRATIYKRSLITQWFDSWHVHDIPSSGRNEWLMIDGLQQTVAYLHDLVRQEAALLPSGEAGVVLGGISQGCAASLVSMALWQGKPLAGVVAMCGWLPLAGEFDNGTGGESDRFDPFERPEEEVDGAERPAPGSAVINSLRERLELPLHDQQDLPPSPPAALSTPVFWGHGTGDEKVPLQLGRKSVECLRSIGVDVSWHAYSGLGHWFSSIMLRDVAQFLQAKTNWGFQGESQVINTTD